MINNLENINKEDEMPERLTLRERVNIAVAGTSVGLAGVALTTAVFVGVGLGLGVGAAAIIYDPSRSLGGRIVLGTMAAGYASLVVPMAVVSSLYLMGESANLIYQSFANPAKLRREIREGNARFINALLPPHPCSTCRLEKKSGLDQYL